ncbi:hypothetical protein Bbelb_422480, partial [Branchiostoma belcheri]
MMEGKDSLQSYSPQLQDYADGDMALQIVTCPKWRRIYPEGGHESDGLVAFRGIRYCLMIHPSTHSFVPSLLHSITVRKSPTDPPTNSFVTSVTVHPATRGITHNHVSCNRKYMEVAHHQIGMPPLKRTGDNVTLMGEERPPGTLQAEVGVGTEKRGTYRRVTIFPTNPCWESTVDPDEELPSVQLISPHATAIHNCPLKAPAVKRRSLISPHFHREQFNGLW